MCFAFLCSFYFTYDRIWAHPNYCVQNRYNDVENSLYQPLTVLATLPAIDNPLTI